MPGFHSRLSPSGAHRYTRCWGAPNAEYGIVDEAGYFAAEGTVYHDIAECCVKFGLEPEDFVGSVLKEDGHTIHITEDFPRLLHKGLARVYELAEGCELVVERRVDLSALLGKGEGGTCDIGIIDRKRREITAFDWKFGAGVPVPPSWTDDERVVHPNEQATLYAWGLVTEFLSTTEMTDQEWTVRIIIEQPRAPGGGGEFEMTLLQLGDEARRIAALAARTRDPKAPRLAGHTQCKFCKAKWPSNGGCDAHTAFIMDMVDADLDEMEEMADLGVDLPMPQRGMLTLDRLAFIHRHADMMTTWLNDIQGYLLDRAKKGVEVPGMKMVAGRRPGRKYKGDSKHAAEIVLLGLLGTEKAYVPCEIISPTEAEKQLGEAKYAELVPFVDRGLPGVALVPIHAKGEALKPSEDMLTDDDVL